MNNDPFNCYMLPVLPTDSEDRKNIPIFSGVMNYFPLAIAAVARVSKRGNDKHNPGLSLRWTRGKSMDHMDCIARHSIDVETIDPKSGEYEDAQALAWRALAKLEELEEKRLGKPISRGSKESIDTEIVRALVDFLDGNGPVAAHQHPNGGGWVADTARVDATAYVGSEAQVSGKAQVYGSARVGGSAKVGGSAVVGGSAWVSGSAQVCVSAQVFGEARVYGEALVSGSAQVYGEALVGGSAQVFDKAQVYGSAWVGDSAWVGGSAQVYGSARVGDSAWVGDSAQVSGKAKVSGSAQVYGEAKVGGIQVLSSGTYQ